MDWLDVLILTLTRLLQAAFLTIAIYRGVKMYWNGENNRLWGHILLSSILAIFVFFPGIVKFLAGYVLKKLHIEDGGFTNILQ
ncbi:hypothetical protein [Effusibacillus consociatus]|uniref:Uncharacterized protein n=1 Tax=Effusibacillus consociatus TaxID=1117041 RepID=A0ABV9Q1D1_9BACL